MFFFSCGSWGYVLFGHQMSCHCQHKKSDTQHHFSVCLLFWGVAHFCSTPGIPIPLQSLRHMAHFLVLVCNIIYVHSGLALEQSVRGTAIFWAKRWWGWKSRYLSACVTFLWTVVERDPSGWCVITVSRNASLPFSSGSKWIGWKLQ